VSLDGFLGIAKPSGCTSHDVVDQIRRLFEIKKVGHTGTLDPMATGVLVLCLGKFTRLSQFVTVSDKKYRAQITLGIDTDTQDSEGQVIAESEFGTFSQVQLGEVLASFLGKSDQIPPMHSAVRIGGKRLYELARKGQEVERPGRAIEIFGIDLIDYQKPHLTLDVWCSKGTYIRTLASDIGKALDCGGHLSSLARTAVGNVSLSDCYSLEELANSLSSQESNVAPFLDVENVLGLPRVSLSKTQLHTFVNGNAITELDNVGDRLGQTLCVFDCDSHLIGIGRWQPEGLRPMRVIAQREG
jgi:tRNA pseudouridine55 synthase